MTIAGRRSHFHRAAICIGVVLLALALVPAAQARVNLRIDAAAAAQIAAMLNNDQTVTITTTATGSSGPGTVISPGFGDIVIAAPINWSLNCCGSARLTLSAYRHINVGARLINTSGVAGTHILLRADNTGTGIGTLQFHSTVPQIDTPHCDVALYYNPSVFGTPQFAANARGVLKQFMLVQNLSQLQAIGANSTSLASDYLLVRDIDASATRNWNGSQGFLPIGAGDEENGAPSYSGFFDGGGHTVSNLYINAPSAPAVGLFGSLGGGVSVEHLHLFNSEIHAGADNADVGSVAGGFSEGSGTIFQVTSSGSVTATGANTAVGGLIGYNSGYVQRSSSSAAVSAPRGAYAGGLIGFNGFLNGAESYRSFATGSVSAPMGEAGGLIGRNDIGEVRQSYATGAVAGMTAGGLIGATGTYNQSYPIESASYAWGAVTAAAGGIAGGLVGQGNGAIEQSYSAGAVSGGTGATLGGLVGALLPGSYPVHASYWDVDMSGLTTSAAGTGKTTAQLQSGTLPGGFTAIWTATKGDYPLLFWQGQQP